MAIILRTIGLFTLSLMLFATSSFADSAGEPGRGTSGKNATYTNNIGDTQLSAVWTDPDFDPTLHAVYYLRVLEIPTPRWSTYDAASLGMPVPDSVPATIQERAWSSPIWYTPDPSLVKKAAFYPGLQPGINN